MGRRIPGLRRKAGKRRPNKIFFLFCEGERTEREYFEGLNRILNHNQVSVEMVVGVGVPKTIVAKAREFINGRRKKRDLQSFERNDEVWAVFDRDEFPQYDEALQECRESGVGIARSNPCFEVWLILHYCDYHKCEHRYKTQEYLESICKGYDRKRRKTGEITNLLSKIDQAEERAERQLRSREEEGSALNAPSTTVHELTRRIRGKSQ